MNVQGSRLSAKVISSSNLAAFCPRCFWIRMKLGNKVPFRTPPPGIFSSIDAYTKRYIEKLLGSGGIAKIIPELTNASKVLKERIPDLRHDYSNGTVFLTGVPDAIFLNNDASYSIVDYKTARFTEAQRSMLPLYEAQVRAYAAMARAAGFKPLNSLLLIYLEPLTGDESIAENISNQGLEPVYLKLNLQPFVHTIKQNEFQVFRLLESADRIIQLPDPPEPLEECESCKAMQNLYKLIPE
ncbi:MAG: PD-(D/E)XK nuclease family protein [Candidatus Thermoplasmatota archaeon]|nr:PD-(D/E)XK nuclease family protein [Candidatus Thermoplasmatota archaeon]